MITQKIKGTKYYAITVDATVIGKAWLDKGQVKIKADNRKTVETSLDTIEALTELHVQFAMDEVVTKKPKASTAKKASKKKTAKKKAASKKTGRRPARRQAEVQLAMQI
jgi:topoisomerase IA-like protein